MNIIEKWNQILNWQEENLKLENKGLNKSISKEEIATIENLLDEGLPEVFKIFYLNGDGQADYNNSLFFGEKFMNAKEIIKHLEYAKSLIKPEVQTIANPEKSQNILGKIVDFYRSNAPKHKLFEIQKSWYKIKFSFSVGSYTGPYLYKSKSTTSKEREVLEITSYIPIENLIKELYELEYESYNWDEIDIVVYADGKFDIERINYNFDNEISFTCTPENAIKKKYFNHKWIPIFSDHGGNFIGIDLDPDVNGKKGQVINFGRDEEKMFVMADNLEEFFDFILAELNINEGQSLKTKYHLHDTIRKLKKY